MIFLAEFNRCLYWFHPLPWWLRGHLGRLAEIACDDAGIDCTGDRTSYARYLLEVAATGSGHRIITAGISMARPSNVESRIRVRLLSISSSGTPGWKAFNRWPSRLSDCLAVSGASRADA